MPTPILNPAFSPSLGLWTSAQVGSSSEGISVADLILDGSITDAQGGALPEAIAIDAINESLGVWQYSVDAGLSWISVEAALLGTSAAPRALGLGPEDRVRLLRNEAQADGTYANALSFRAWDLGVGGATGQYLDAQPNAAYLSAERDSAAVTLGPDLNNFAPISSPLPGLGTGVLRLGPRGDVASEIKVLQDGSILLFGTSTDQTEFAMARLRPDGTLDTSFGIDGVLSIPLQTREFFPREVVIQPNGQILVLGEGHDAVNFRQTFGVWRLNPDGSFDASFGSQGRVTVDASRFVGDEPESLAVQPDGRIVLVGMSTIIQGRPDPFPHFSVIRLNTDGSIDSSFQRPPQSNPGVPGVILEILGGVNDKANTVVIQPDGKILVAGRSVIEGRSQFSIIRLNADSTLDSSFDFDGKLAFPIGSQFDSVSTVVVLDDGSILLGGVSRDSNLCPSLARLNPDGSFDTRFGVGGKLMIPCAAEENFTGVFTVLADGRLLFVGDSLRAEGLLLCVTADGVLDPSFGDGGRARVTFGPGQNFIASATVQDDGKILVSGGTGDWHNFEFAFARFNPDGTLDTSFNPVATLPGLPLLAGPYVATYVEDGDAVLLDPTHTFYDADLASLANGLGNYAGARVVLARDTGPNATDVFTGLGDLILTAQGKVEVSGVIIGTFTQASGTLELVFNDQATQLRLDVALSNIGYRNTSDAPPTSIQIRWVFNDQNTGGQGAGPGLSVEHLSPVDFVAVNDAPVLNRGIPDQRTPHDQPYLFQLASDTFRDPDVTDVLTWSAARADGSPLPDWLQFNPQTRQFSGTPPVTATGDYTLRVTVTDEAGASAFDDFTLTIEDRAGPTDWAFLLAPDTSKRGRSLEEGTVLGSVTALGDPNSNAFTYSFAVDAAGNGASQSMSGLRIDAATGRITTTRTLEDSRTLWVRVEDQSGNAFSKPLVLTLGSGDRDTLAAASGGAVVFGLGKDDRITGSARPDALSGGEGDDFLQAGAGADQLDGGSGKDVMMGGAGDDLYFVDHTRDRIIEFSGGGLDTVRTFLQQYRLDTELENLSYLGRQAFDGQGNSRANVLSGGVRDDKLQGADGNDSLLGWAGADVLAGDAGHDTLNGGTGADELTGGTGADVFFFAAGDSGQRYGKIDTIRDFSKAPVGSGDSIAFTAALTPGGSAAAATSAQAAINQSTGIAQFAPGSASTLHDAVRDIATRFTAAGDAAGEFAFFKTREASHYSLFISDGVAGVGAGDLVVSLVGITSIGAIDLTAGELAILF